ncbi:hypothetical protein AMTRI_Chr05g64150 [Amborella trichopoda]
MAPNEKLSQDDGAQEADAPSYISLVGSLIYLTNTRPDIVHVVSIVPRFMSKPSKLHFLVKRILRYVQGTRSFSLKYTTEKDNSLAGYTDRDWAGSLDDRKSTSGYVFYLGSKVISWSSRKQKTVALSSAEAEYISATSTACEAVWLRKILYDLHHKQKDPTTIYCDNMSIIAMTKNPIFHNRTKHIELCHHFITDLVEKGEIELKFISTNDQLVDIFTKSLSIDKFMKLREKKRVTN